MENQIRQKYRYCLLWKNCLTEKFFPCLLFQAGTIRDASGKSSISVEDYAAAMIDELEKPVHHRERFTIGY